MEISANLWALWLRKDFTFFIVAALYDEVVRRT